MALCSIYRSDRQAETYLYLAHGQAFSDLPPELRQLFGEPAFVMHLDLAADRRLARVETRIVLEQLQTEGFYLQLPPEMPTEEEIKQRFSSIGPDRA